MERKMIWCLRVFWFLVGFMAAQLIQPAHAQINDLPCRSLRMTQLDCVALFTQSAERQRQRETAQREVDTSMELKHRAERLNQLYEGIRDTWQAAVDAQQRQIENQAHGIVDIKQDVVVEKLTKEMADRANELYKLNKRH